MTTLVKMDEDWGHMTERILDLTLEIIYLLTGEEYEVVMKKSGDLMLNSPLCGPAHATRPPTRPLMLKRSKKVLEITDKIIEILAREVPIRCQENTVEDGETLEEGHKDLYQDVIVESRPPDGFSNKNPPERCAGGLCSRVCMQDDHIVPHHYQQMVAMSRI
ncbi:gastrula zinc finger protein XlCGF66.1-like isoform X2 [Hyperolius riggenbachi]|uniref:gastrula zinc finger protein XlCGF66.1-like isoform X2 n=1 Tax=Hyperolius riggenbachi TaxID=752182 RepID=UPI0035A2C794